LAFFEAYTEFEAGVNNVIISKCRGAPQPARVQLRNDHRSAVTDTLSKPDT